MVLSLRRSRKLNHIISQGCIYHIVIRRFNQSTPVTGLSISPRVLDAIHKGQPIVALESTIISHGMPYPRNIEVANLIESTVRDHGAIPATIAIIDGIPKIGLNSDEIVHLADSSRHVMKVSTRDIAYAISEKKTGATTVAGTMVLAHMAGISVFATGGIGGVHRGAESTFDISADLIELGHTPVTVVCAGIKSILDIPKTLEFLETRGVPVIGYKSKEFPAFFTNDSGIKSPLYVDDIRTIANMILNNKMMGIKKGMVVGVPNPLPADNNIIQAAIDQAIKEAVSKGISGHSITPYVLAAIERITSGQSLESNIALVLNNAKIASQIAIELVSKAKASHSIQMPSNTNKSFENPNSTTIPITESSKDVPKSNIPEIKSDKVMDAGTSISRIICVGGAVVDMIGTITSKLIINSSNPGTMSMSYGGVVFNISQNLVKNHNVRHSVELVSAVGLDNHGQALLHYANSIGINTSILETISKEIHEAYTDRTTSKPSALNALYKVFNPSIPISNRLHTATYTAIHGPDGDLHVAVADMNILHQISKHHISNITTKIRTSDIVIVDGNITPDAFAALVGVCQTYMIPVFFEPTSDHKCVLPVQAKSMNKIDIMKPNVSELITLVQACVQNNLIVRNRANIQNVLRNLSIESFKPNDDTKYSQDMIDNIQTLASGLLHVMFDPSHSSHIFYKMTSNTTRTNNQLTSEGRIRRVHGKHVFVSMGAQGVLWCGSKHVLLRDPDLNLDQVNTIRIVDDEVACVHVPAIPISSKDLKHTSGAGDAFCAGLVSSLFEGSRSGGPTWKGVYSGLSKANSHLIDSSA